MLRAPPGATLFPYTTLFRSCRPPPPPRRPFRSSRSRLRPPRRPRAAARSEEHTSELQSRVDLVCRLLLEKKKTDPARRREHRPAERRLLREADIETYPPPQA